jgi:hypothetical protein
LRGGEADEAIQARKFVDADLDRFPPRLRLAVAMTTREPPTVSVHVGLVLGCPPRARREEAAMRPVLPALALLPTLALLPVPALLLLAAPVRADRPATADERARVEDALTAFGCTAGDIAFDEDDGHYVVDDADCGNGRRYDFELDGAFRIVDGERPVTPGETSEIDAALGAEGCSGGRAKYDIADGAFEVDDAVCDDGESYAFELDRGYAIVARDRE